MCDLDDDWENFLTNNDAEFNVSTSYDKSSLEASKEEVIPKCSELYISTKTVISYLNKNNLDIKSIFWNIPVISYSNLSEGVIKKQIKFATTEREELINMQEKLKNIPFYEEQVIEHIDNPTGRIKFKDQRKLSVGLCKKDLVSYRSKKKRAFFNCFVLIFRIYDDNAMKYKEMHIKVFNTGKLEIPGVQNNSVLDKIINMLVIILKPIVGDDLEYIKSRNETVLINSNFNCGFFIDRDKFHDILKYKYRINSSFDSCSYPGIQCKFYYITGVPYEEQTGAQPTETSDHQEISFMIFRTGSILIVGKCEQDVLEVIYKKLISFIQAEYSNISMGNINISVNNSTKPPIVKKMRKKTLHFTPISSS